MRLTDLILVSLYGFSVYVSYRWLARAMVIDDMAIGLVPPWTPWTFAKSSMYGFIATMAILIIPGVNLLASRGVLWDVKRRWVRGGHRCP